MHLYASNAVFLPRNWCALLKAPPHEMAVLAVNAIQKRDVPALLTDHEWPPLAADVAAKALRIQQAPAIRLLQDAKVFHPEDVAVYAWKHVTDGSLVIRAYPIRPGQPSQIRVVARFRLVDGERYAEAVSEAGFCPACGAADVCTFDPAPPSEEPTHHVCQVCEYGWPA